MNIKTTLIALLFCNISLAHSLDSLVLRTRAYGLGIPFVRSLNKNSSALAYAGTGLAELKTVEMKCKAYKSISQFQFVFTLANPKPVIENRVDWNKSQSFYNMQFEYNYLKGLSKNSVNKIHYYLGGGASSILQFISYPTINNKTSYNFNWFNLNIASGFIYDFKLFNRNNRLHYLISLPIVSYNENISSYAGILDQKIIWNQADNSSLFFKEGKLTYLFNNVIVNSSLAWYFPLKKNELMLSYNWLLLHNARSINKSTTVKSSIAISYCFTRKKSKS